MIFSDLEKQSLIRHFSHALAVVKDCDLEHDKEKSIKLVIATIVEYIELQQQDSEFNKVVDANQALAYALTLCKAELDTCNGNIVKLQECSDKWADRFDILVQVVDYAANQVDYIRASSLQKKLLEALKKVE